MSDEITKLVDITPELTVYSDTCEDDEGKFSKLQLRWHEGQPDALTIQLEGPALGAFMATSEQFGATETALHLFNSESFKKRVLSAEGASIV